MFLLLESALRYYNDRETLLPESDRRMLPESVFELSALGLSVLIELLKDPMSFQRILPTYKGSWGNSIESESDATWYQTYRAQKVQEHDYRGRFLLDIVEADYRTLDSPFTQVCWLASVLDHLKRTISSFLPIYQGFQETCKSYSLNIEAAETIFGKFQTFCNRFNDALKNHIMGSDEVQSFIRFKDNGDVLDTRRYGRFVPFLSQGMKFIENLTIELMCSATSKYPPLEKVSSEGRSAILNKAMELYTSLLTFKLRIAFYQYFMQKASWLLMETYGDFSRFCDCSKAYFVNYADRLARDPFILLSLVVGGTFSKDSWDLATRLIRRLLWSALRYGLFDSLRGKLDQIHFTKSEQRYLTQMIVSVGGVCGEELTEEEQEKANKRGCCIGRGLLEMRRRNK